MRLSSLRHGAKSIKNRQNRRRVLRRRDIRNKNLAKRLWQRQRAETLKHPTIEGWSGQHRAIASDHQPRRRQQQQQLHRPDANRKQHQYTKHRGVNRATYEVMLETTQYNLNNKKEQRGNSDHLIKSNEPDYDIDQYHYVFNNPSRENYEVVPR